MTLTFVFKVDWYLTDKQCPLLILVEGFCYASSHLSLDVLADRMVLTLLSTYPTGTGMSLFRRILESLLKRCSHYQPLDNWCGKHRPKRTVSIYLTLTIFSRTYAHLRFVVHPLFGPCLSFKGSVTVWEITFSL